MLHEVPRKAARSCPVGEGRRGAKTLVGGRMYGGAQLPFVCLDAIMKVLVQTYPVGMAVTVCNFAQVPVLLGLAPIVGSSMLQTRRWAFHDL
jgi:hypothetical protein